MTDPTPRPGFLRRPLPTTPARFLAAACAAYAALLLWLMLSGAARLSGSRRKRFFQEDGVVENLQAWHLIIATMLFSAGAALAARRARLEAWFLAGIAAMTLWACNREFDFLWKHNGFKLEYQAAKWSIAALGIAIALVRLRPLFIAWRADPFRPVFVCVYLGVGGYAAAQLISTAIDAMETPRYVHRAAQEAIELLASAFFLFGALEALRRERWLDRPRRARRIRLYAAPAWPAAPDSDCSSASPQSSRSRRHRAAMAKSSPPSATRP